MHVSMLNQTLLLLSNVPWYGYTTSIDLLISLFTFGLFPLFAIMASASVNIYVQLFVWTYAFNSLGYTPSRIAGSCCNAVFNHLRIARLFPKITVPFYILPAVNEGPNFSTSLPTLIIMSPLQRNSFTTSFPIWVTLFNFLA